MVPWWKRLVFGLVGWVIATCVAGVLASIWVFIHFPAKRAVSVSDLFEFWLLFLISALAMGVFGWLMGIPFVLLVRNSRGWRFWIYLALGTGIGPCLIFGFSLFALVARASSGSLTTGPADYSAVPISAVISSFTTLIYLLLLQRARLARNGDRQCGSYIPQGLKPDDFWWFWRHD